MRFFAATIGSLSTAFDSTIQSLPLQVFPRLLVGLDVLGQLVVFLEEALLPLGLWDFGKFGNCLQVATRVWMHVHEDVVQGRVGGLGLGGYG